MYELSMEQDYSWNPMEVRNVLDFLPYLFCADQQSAGCVLPK